MAIQITNQPTNPPYPAYNNSIIEFTSDAGTPITADIIVNGYTFEQSADADGIFHFNLKRIIEVLINQNNFSDHIAIDNPADFLFLDQTLFLDVEIEIIISFADDSQESQTFTWPYIKSVIQEGEKQFNNSQLKLLAPYANDICHLTYFEGYPFDISIYSDIARLITITNLRTGLATDLNLLKGVNRLFISNGENDNLGFESQLPLYLGINELEFKANDQIYFTLLLNKRSPECGNLLKFFNRQGGWSYWNFMDLHVEKTKADTIDRLNSDFNNVDKSRGNFAITGKEAEKSRSLLSGLVQDHEKKLISQLPTSPKVYLYTNELASPFELNDFIEVEVDGGTFSTSNKHQQSVFNLTINLPKIYTQTL
jgi:hypothetical protein